MQVQQKGLVWPHLPPGLVDQEEALGGAVEDRAEVGADRLDQPLGVVERAAEPRRGGAHVRLEGMSRDGLDAELAEDERQHEAPTREAVVDDDSKAALANRSHRETVEQVARVALARAGRIADGTDRAERHAP